MQASALFPISQASPHNGGCCHLRWGEHSAFTRNFSFLIRRAPMFIGSSINSQTLKSGTHRSSHELLLQVQLPSTQPPQQLTQQQLQFSKYRSSWADEIAAEWSNCSTLETVVPNWAYTGRVSGRRPRSQPLVYPPQHMPTQASQPSTTECQYWDTEPPQCLLQGYNNPSDN